MSMLVPLTLLMHDVKNSVMDFCSKQSASVIDLASAALKSTAYAYFSFDASGVQLVMK